MGRHAPDILEIAGAWDRLRQAIECVETAQPVQMSAAIVALRDQRMIFEDLILGRPKKAAQQGAASTQPEEPR